MIDRLIELGADKEFKKYLSNDLTQGLTLDDYVKYYLKINVLSRFAVQEISPANQSTARSGQSLQDDQALNNKLKDLSPLISPTH